MRCSLVLLVLLAVAAPARAGDFAQFARDLSANPKAAAQRYTSCDLMVLPSGSVRRPCKLELADVSDGDSAAKLEAGKVSMHAFANSTYNWQEVDVVARSGGTIVATFHVLEVGSTENPRGEFVVLASQWSRVIEDAYATTRAKEGSLRAPSPIADTMSQPKIALDAQDKRDREQAMEDTKSALSGRDIAAEVAGWLDDGATFIGSAPKQTLTGKSGGKTLRSWNLELAPRGGIAVGGEPRISWGATQVVGTSKSGGADAPSITYVAFFVFTRRTPAGGTAISVPALAQFAIPQ